MASPEPETLRRKRLGWLILPAVSAAWVLSALAFGFVVAGPVTTDAQPQAIPTPAASPSSPVIPAIVVPSPSPGTTTAFFDAPEIKIEPPPPIVKKPGSSGKYTTTSSGTVVDVCSLQAFSVRTVTSAPYSSAEQSNFTLLNDARSDAGLSSLGWSDNLANHARAWASFLAQNDCVIYHGDNWQNGENIYWRSGGSLADLASLAHAGFMGSPGHKANILRDWFVTVGVGVAKSPSGAWYLVQNFGA